MMVFKIQSLQTSPMYIGYLIFLHIFIYICTAVVLPNPLHAMVLFFLILSFLFYFEGGQKIISLECIRKTEWILHDANHQAMRMQLLPSSVMMRYFLILHFKSEITNQKQTVVLFADMFSDENYRQLRACVKMGYL